LQGGFGRSERDGWRVRENEKKGRKEERKKREEKRKSEGGRTMVMSFGKAK